MSEVALKEYLENRIECLAREIAVQRDGDMLARKLAADALEARLDSMNLFRDQILEERTFYVRVDTFKWTVGFIVSLVLALISIAKFWR